MKKEMAKLTTGDFADFFLTNPTSKTQTSRGRALSAYSRPNTSKFSTIRSVTRGIRNLNITQIVRPNRNLMQLQAPELVLPEDESLNTLAMIKRVHDKTLTTANQEQRNIKALRADNEKLKIRELQTFDNNTQIDRDNALYQQQAGFAGETFQNTCWTMKSYEWIADRLKNDKMSYEKRLGELQEEIRRKQNQMRDIHQKFQNVRHLNSNTTHVLKILRNDAQLLSEMKDERLQAFQQGIQNQKQMKMLKDNQLQDIDGIMQYAMQDKGSNEKTWRKLFLAHKFLKGILKAKMQRQMKKFTIIQQSYQRIKTQSGVVKAQDIVKKFTLRDESYGNLLASISQAQRRIVLLKKQNEQLKQRERIAEEVAVDLDKPIKKNHISLEEDYKKVSKISQLTLKSQKAEEQLWRFAIQTLKKIDLIEGKRSIDHSKTFSKANIRQIYDFLNMRIKGIHIEDIRSQIESQQLIDIEVTNPNNFRVSHQLQFDSEDDLKQDEQFQEDSYVDAKRNKLNKINADFFLGLKKKYQQNLKNRLEREKIQSMLSAGGKRGDKDKKDKDLL